MVYPTAEKTQALDSDGTGLQRASLEYRRLPANSSARRELGRSPIILALIVFIAVVCAGSRILADPDVYLHVAIGRWIMAHREIPHHDVFSFSMAGSPWVAHEWLAGVASACLYDALGWGGLLIAAALCFATAIALLFAVLMRDLEPAPALAGALLAAGLAFPHLFARPHVFTLPLLVLWTSILVEAARRREAPPPWIAALMVLWANLHGSYMVGEALIVLFACESLLDASSWRAAASVLRSWGFVVCLSILAALVTPNFLDGVLLPIRLMRMDFMMSYIGEWRSPDFQLGHPLEFWVMLGLFGALTIGVKLPPTRLIITLLLLHTAFLHQRNAELLGLVAPIVLAPSLGPQLRRFGDGAASRLMRRLYRPASVGFVSLLAVIFVGVNGLAVRANINNDNPEYAPARALAFVKAKHIDGPVFNAINFGDYLLFSGTAPFIDGRVDMYGDAFLRRYAEVGEFPELVKEYNIRWAILNLKNPHVALLDHLPGWDALYRDDVAAVYLKRNTTGGQVPEPNAGKFIEAGEPRPFDADRWR